jgi:transketolase
VKTRTCLRPYPSRRKHPQFAVMLFAACTILITGCETNEAAALAAPDVEVVQVVQRDVPITKNWVASLNGIVNAQIPAQVTGYLLNQGYTNGAYVQKGSYGWQEDAKFLVPDGVYQHFADGIGARGAQAHHEWTVLFARYRAKYAGLANEIDLMRRRELPPAWDRNLPVFPAAPTAIAGREASGKVLNTLAQNIPWFLGGSGDLGPSNKTTLKHEGAGNIQSHNPSAKNLHSDIREHSMAAIVNGLSLSKIRVFGAPFFIFSDYLRPGIPLSALIELPTILVFAYDAMGDGEDGPTHQPIEHLASLRAIPGLILLRPGDADEVMEEYRYILHLHREPAVLALSRQPLPTLDRCKYASAAGGARGAYILADAPGRNPHLIIMR